MEIRVVVCGDEGVGKSSLIAVLVKDTFVPSIQTLLPPITIPGLDSTSPNTSTTTVVVDTSSLPSDRDGLNHEIRRASVIWLAYADHFTFERVSLFWLPYFRSLGVNVPVILCANKSDLHKTDAPEVIMEEFKEVEACIECSAKDNYNVNEAFYLCQRAVTHPLAPLYDSKEHKLKPLAQSALTRVFFLCDKDQDGYLSETELSDLQYKAFKKHLKRSELQEIRRALILYDKQQQTNNGTATNNNNNNGNNSNWMSERAFILLNQLFAERGRHETTWGILRAFHYTDSLSLDDKFLYPKLDVPLFSSVELSPVGYRFFVDLFILFDKDNDGGLSDMELTELFKPTPGIPELWRETNFPNATVRNEAGYITLQGWLAQWSMTTFLDYKVTLAYLAWLGFESGKSKGGSTLDALLVTKPRKRSTKRPKAGKVDRNVFQCFILGAPGSGKSVLLDRFLSRPFYQVYIPTITNRIAVNSVETRGGKQCYMIIEELGSLESAILANQAKLDQCDLICYTYDSSDPESFSYLIDLRNKYPQLDQLPVVYAALKADLDKQQQRCELQPDAYTREIGVAAPLHVSSQWPGTSFSSSLAQLFIEMAEAAQIPSTATPRLEPQPDPEYSIRPMILAVSAFSLMTATAAWIWQNARKTSW